MRPLALRLMAEAPATMRWSRTVMPSVAAAAVKRPIYAREGVSHLWFVDPLARVSLSAKPCPLGIQSNQ